MFWSLPSTRATALLPRTSTFLDVMSAVMFRRSFAGMPFLTSHAVAASIAIGVAASSEQSESTTDTCGYSAEPLEHVIARKPPNVIAVFLAFANRAPIAFSAVVRPEGALRNARARPRRRGRRDVRCRARTSTHAHGRPIAGIRKCRPEGGRAHRTPSAGAGA